MGIYWFQLWYPDLGWKTLIETRSKTDWDLCASLLTHAHAHTPRCAHRPTQRCQNQNGHFNTILLSCSQEFWSKTLQDDADSLIILHAALVIMSCNSMKKGAGNPSPSSASFSNPKDRKTWKSWLRVAGGPKTLYFGLGFEPFPLYNANSA